MGWSNNRKAGWEGSFRDWEDSKTLQSAQLLTSTVCDDPFSDN